MTLIEIARELERLAHELRKLADGDEDKTGELKEVKKALDGLSKSIASFAYYEGVPSIQIKKKVLKIFVDKGTSFKNGEKFCERILLSESTDYEMYTLDLSEDDLKNKKNELNLEYCTINGLNSIIIGDEGDSYRLKAERSAGLTIIASGKILLEYLGSPVKIERDNYGLGITVERGVILDEEGNPHPYIKNIEEQVHPGRTLRITNGVRESIIKAKDLEVILV